MPNEGDLFLDFDGMLWCVECVGEIYCTLVGTDGQRRYFKLAEWPPQTLTPANLNDLASNMEGWDE